MTRAATPCAEVRERLLEIDTSELDALRPHLRNCPDCAAVADAVLSVEDGLRTHLEDTVDAFDLDTHWARADDAVPERRSRWLHAGLIGLAAAAVLAVGVWSALPHAEDPIPPDGPDADIALASPALFDAMDAVDAFDAVLPPEIHDGLAREEQDARLTDALREKSDAFRDAEEALLVAAEDDDPSVRAAALLELGDLYLRMAEALLDLPAPTYLTEGQSEFYGMALEDKAIAQLAKARNMLELGLELAEDHELGPEIDAFDEALLDVDAVEASLAPDAMDRNCHEVSLIKGGQRMIMLVDDNGMPCEGGTEDAVHEHDDADAHRSETIRLIGVRLTELHGQLDCDGTGRVRLDFTVESDGSVSRPSATPLEPRATQDLAACVLAQMREWRFPGVPEHEYAVPIRHTLTFPLPPR